MKKNLLGFSLMEIMLTVAIAGILIAVAMPVATTALRRSFDRETREEMREVVTAIRMHYDSLGSFPAEVGGLIAEPDGGLTGWDGPYVSSEWSANSGFSDVLSDEWGSPYTLVAGASDEQIILRSFGPNRVDDSGSEDDVSITLDMAFHRRQETARELRELNFAIASYNSTNLPDDPLPDDIDEICDELVEDGFLPDDDEDYSEDANGDPYVPGDSPVTEVFPPDEGGGVDGLGDDDDDDGGGEAEGEEEEEMFTICHRPPGNPSAAHTIRVGKAAYAAHLAHGDTLGACCPEYLDFETEDDYSTPIVDGQQIISPPHFGNLVTITASGSNYGPAIFDTTTGGPNDPGRDPDMLVDLGNVLILQENNTQTVAGVYDYPDDDVDGGALIFSFVEEVEMLSVRLIDVDAGNQGVRVSLTDADGGIRTYDVPGGWTRDVAHEGRPGYGNLDLTSTSPQVGYAATATASESPAFDALGVVQMTVTFTSSGGLDNVVFCPK